MNSAVSLRLRFESLIVPRGLAAMVLAAVLGLSGCMVLPLSGPAARAGAGAAPAAGHAASAPSNGASSPAQGASGPRPPGAPPVAQPPGNLRPFADIVKDAKQIDGLFTLWQKDDKVWIELKPSDLNQPFFFSPKYKTGIGEQRIFAGTMADELVVEFRRIHNQMQLIARNTDVIGRPGTPEGRAMEVAFSPSLVGSAPVLSQPHPERKSVLIEANAIFVSDLLAIGGQLQRSFRQGYSFDGRNSAITAVRGTPDLVVLEVMGHYATGSLSQPAPGAPPGAPVPSVPRSLPDARSMFITMHYSLGRLPTEPMRPRKSDPRIGYFTSAQFDFSDDLAPTPRKRYVNRWRLEKKDPAAELSEPVKQITYWIDRDMPVKYRAAVTAGILEWNKAFERIGFKDAIKVEIQPDDADFDTLDVNRASVRWMTNWNPQFGAIGPSHVDPRTGEILDADIGIESLSSRSVRTLRSQVMTERPFDIAQTETGAPFPGAVLSPFASSQAHSASECTYADGAAEQLSYALDIMQARGDIDPASPEAEQFVLDYLKDTTMHEVGHTLGLRHNFRASRVYTDAQLSDPAFTQANGLAGSVMEYTAINISEPGVPMASRGQAFQTTLGPYDYWAIEYAYKPLAAEVESAELLKIAGRSGEPLLAYGTDEDSYLGIDPESLQFDLGSDAIVFAKKRLAIAQDLLKQQERRPMRLDQDYAVLRRSINYALRDVGRAAGQLVRQIGGVRTLRDYPGTGRDPLAPVPAAQQREALDLLANGMLSPNSLNITPALQRRLATDFEERSDALRSASASSIATDYSFTEAVSGLQRGVLAALMNDGVTSRLLDSEEKQPFDALRLSELYARLDRAVWGDLAVAGDIPPLRRELQRDYVNRLASLVLRPGASSRADARGLLRVQAQGLLKRLQGASSRGGLSAEARAHLLDSADSLREALAARLMRQGS